MVAVCLKRFVLIAFLDAAINEETSVPIFAVGADTSQSFDGSFNSVALLELKALDVHDLCSVLKSSRQDRNIRNDIGIIPRVEDKSSRRSSSLTYGDGVI